MNFTENMFTSIYTQHLWPGDETRSGEGSTLSYTASIRSALPEMFAKFGIKSVLDAPCGDFNWMRELMNSCPDIDYTGADIVRPMIDQLQQSDTGINRRFVHLDITQDQLPTADLMISRDCWFHLSQELVGSVIRNFADSDIKYLLTTTYYNDGSWTNVDLNVGGFHPIDLLAEPYNFDPAVLHSIEDWHGTHRPRRLCLWSREQIQSLL